MFSEVLQNARQKQNMRAFKDEPTAREMKATRTRAGPTRAANGFKAHTRGLVTLEYSWRKLKLRVVRSQLRLDFFFNSTSFY